MTHAKWIFTGIGIAALAFLVTCYIFVKTYVDGFSALDKPSGAEAWIAGIARSVAMPGSAKDRKNPLQPTPEALAEGRAHFADHCATCHANNGSGDSEIGSRVYPRPPDLRKKDTQQMTDGELFYSIEKGIRWTAMPGWQGSHSDEDTWKLVLFIRHLPNLSPDELNQMEQLNPKSPDELKEEQDEQHFLNGQPSDQPKSKTEH